MVGQDFEQLIARIPDLAQIQIAEDSSSTVVFELENSTSFYEVSHVSVRDTDHSLLGRLYLLHDITHLMENLNHLTQLNDALGLSDRIIESASEGIILTDAEGRILRANASFEHMTGYPVEELVGNNPRLMKSDRHDAGFYENLWRSLLEEGHWEGEI